MGAHTASPTHPRVANFIRLLAQHLSQTPPWNSPSTSVLQTPELAPFLHQAVLELPQGKLRSALQQDLDRFVETLRHEIEVARERAESIQHASRIQALLDLVQRPLLADSSYVKAVEAVVEAVVNGVAASGQVSDWCRGALRLLQARKDPPLQLLWAYATLEASRKSDSCTEDSAFSSSAEALWRCLKLVIVGQTSAATAVASLAPIIPVTIKAIQQASRVLGLHRMSGASEGLAVEESVSDETNSSGKKVRNDIKLVKDIVRGILSFIVVCRDKEKSGAAYSFSLRPAPAQPERLRPAFGSFRFLLQSLKVDESLRKNEDVFDTKTLKAMFPLVSKPSLKALMRSDVDIGYVCGIVASEVVLLQLVLEVIEWRSKLKQQAKTADIGNLEARKELTKTAVHSVLAAGGHLPFGADLMLDVVLSSHLPIGNVLGNEDTAFIRGILYEAALVEQPSYGRLDTVSPVKGPGKDSIVFIKRISVARRAISYYRSIGERSHALTLLAAVSTSHVPSQLVHWLRALKIKQKPSEADLRNQQALIGWLISLEDGEFKGLFDKLVTLDGPKLTIDTAQEVSLKDDKGGAAFDSQMDAVTTEVGSQIETKEDIFFIDTKGEANVKLGVEEADKAFMTAVTDMRSTVGNVKMRKKSKILFHRHRHTADLKKPQRSVAKLDLDFSLSDESEESVGIRKQLGKRPRRERKVRSPGQGDGGVESEVEDADEGITSGCSESSHDD